eukprot:3271765-Prymnesium_polylepis.1
MAHHLFSCGARPARAETATLIPRRPAPLPTRSRAAGACVGRQPLRVELERRRIEQLAERLAGGRR